MQNIPRFLLPSIVGISVYMTIHKFFTEKVEGFPKDLQKDVKHIKGVSRIALAKGIAKKLLENKALKFGLLSVFATVGIQHGIEALLVEYVFKRLCTQKTGCELTILCDIIREHELDLHTKAMELLIVSNRLGREEKVCLLKIKLDCIINGECGEEKRFLLMSILAILLTCTISGVGGLALVLEALLRLFQEGKISRSMYKYALKVLAKRWGAEVPVEHLLA